MYTGPLCAIVILTHITIEPPVLTLMISHPFITKAILQQTIIHNASLIFRRQFFDMVFCEKCDAAYNLVEHTECPACAEKQEQMNATLPPRKRRRVQECGIYVEIASSRLPGDLTQPSSAASCHQPRPSSRHQQTPSTAPAAVNNSSAATGSISYQLMERLHYMTVANRRLLQPYQNLRNLPNHGHANQQPVPESSVSTAAAPNAGYRPLPFRVP